MSRHIQEKKHPQTVPVPDRKIDVSHISKLHEMILTVELRNNLDAGIQTNIFCQEQAGPLK